MRRTGTACRDKQVPDRRGSLRRGILLGTVIAFHMLGYLALLAWRPDAPDVITMDSVSALEVRFVDRPRPVAPATVSMRPPAAPRTASRPVRQPLSPASAHPQERDPDTSAKLPSPPPAISFQNSVLPNASQHVDEPENSSAASYMPNSAVLQGDGGMATRRTIHLPGGPPGKAAPVLRLADPRTQGVAGAARMIQGFLGVTDKHCLQVDTWQGMTPEERVAQHVTDADIALSGIRRQAIPQWISGLLKQAGSSLA